MSKRLPEGWEKVRLRDVSTHINDKINAKVSPYIEIGDIDTGAWTYKIKNKAAPSTATKAKEREKKDKIMFESLQTIKSALMQALLTGEVRVKI